MRPPRPHLLWLLALLLAPLLAGAMAHGAPVRTLNFEQLSVKDGLAQETVTAIVQDQQGFMWFGSQHGLSRYDGYRVTVYRTTPNDPHSLADNWVQALYIDKQNRLWVGTRGGLQRFNPASDNFTLFQTTHNSAPADNDGSKHQVQAIIGDGYNQLWVAGSDGVQHFDPESGQFDVLRHDPANPASLVNNHVTTLVRDGTGQLWVGTKSGLDRLAPGSRQFSHFHVDQERSANTADNEVLQLWVDQNQLLWIVTMDGLVTWQLGPGAMRQHRYGPADGLPPGLITALLQDRDNSIWLGTATDGLYHWDSQTKRFVSYPADPHSVAGNEVAALFQDHTGTLWIGTWTAGLKRVDLASGGFNRLYHAPGRPGTLHDNRVYGISADGHGQLLLSGLGGIDRYDPVSGLATLLGTDERLASRMHNNEIVLASYLDRRGNVWIGTSAGFGRFDPQRGSFEPHPFGGTDPNSESVAHIDSAGGGALWIATHGGLHHYDPASGATRTYRHDPADQHSLSDNWVKMTLQDGSSGGWWVATDDGLNRFDPATGRFTRYRHNAADAGSLSSDRVQYLFADRAGTLWVGTNAGLDRLERGAGDTVRFHSYTTRDGLAADSIGAILQDENGQLWLSTAAGISRFSAPEHGAPVVRNYSARDGMIEGFYYAGSALRGADGTMYFGGVNGMTAFRPEQIHDNPYPPPVLISDILVFGKSLTTASAAQRRQAGLTAAPQDSKHLTLSYDQSVLGIEFAALHYADPQRNRFRYQLQGFDRHWVDTDAGQRSATYTNLDPGHYLFRVKAANKDGVWSTSAATLAITITPPYWQTWWFRSALVALLAGLVWGSHLVRAGLHRQHTRRLETQVSARTAQVERQKAQLQSAQSQLQRYVEDRERLFVSISHDLRTPITRLKLRTELLDDVAVRDEFHEDLDDLDMMVKGALQTVKDSDIHENTTALKLDGLIERLQRGAQLAGHEVTYQGSGLTVLAKPLALKRAIGNLLDNALFYGQRAQVEARVDGAWVAITIRDHGPGVAADVIDQLFQPNVRLEHGRQQNAGGLGLGLGIARGIIEAHGGALLLANHPDGGLLATIRLPAPA